MNLINWDPLRDLEWVSSFFSRLLGRFSMNLESNGKMVAEAAWMPSVELCETEVAYLIKCEIPGINREDVKISIQDGMLTLEKISQHNHNDKNLDVLRIKRSCGSFERSFRIPDDADEAAIEAEFEAGMLNVTLPKSTKANSRTINLAMF